MKRRSVVEAGLKYPGQETDEYTETGINQPISHGKKVKKKSHHAWRWRQVMETLLRLADFRDGTADVTLLWPLTIDFVLSSLSVWRLPEGALPSAGSDLLSKVVRSRSANRASRHISPCLAPRGRGFSSSFGATRLELRGTLDCNCNFLHLTGAANTSEKPSRGLRLVRTDWSHDKPTWTTRKLSSDKQQLSPSSFSSHI